MFKQLLFFKWQVSSLFWIIILWLTACFKVTCISTCACSALAFSKVRGRGDLIGQLSTSGNKIKVLFPGIIFSKQGTLDQWIFKVYFFLNLLVLLTFRPGRFISWLVHWSRLDCILGIHQKVHQKVHQTVGYQNLHK